MKIFKDNTSFDREVWVCIHNEYLYIEATLEKLIETINNEWEQDKHLIA